MSDERRSGPAGDEQGQHGLPASNPAVVDATASDPSRVKPPSDELRPAAPPPSEPPPTEAVPTDLPQTQPAPTDLSPTDLPVSGQSDPICQICGRVGSGGDLLRWVLDRRAGRLSWTCPSCVAANIRSLEAKLDPEWW